MVAISDLGEVRTIKPESVVGARRAGSGGGCVLFLAGLFVGFCLAIYQNWILLHTWAFCAGVDVAIVLDRWSGGYAYVGLVPIVLRTVLYGLVFWLAYVACNAVLRPSSRWVRVVAGLLAALGACVVVFALDFSLTSGMGAGSYLANKCPGGHLPWWPF